MVFPWQQPAHFHSTPGTSRMPPAGFLPGLSSIVGGIDPVLEAAADLSLVLVHAHLPSPTWSSTNKEEWDIYIYIDDIFDDYH